MFTISPKCLILLVAVCVATTRASSPQEKNKTQNLHFASESEISSGNARADGEQQNIMAGRRQLDKSLDQQSPPKRSTLEEFQDNVEPERIAPDGQLQTRPQEFQHGVIIENSVPQTFFPPPNGVDTQGGREGPSDLQFSDDAAQQALKRLEHSELYGKVQIQLTNNSRRSYKSPPDLFRCGLCLCFESSEDHVVFADCMKYKTVRLAIRSIPEDLPYNTIHVYMDHNTMEQFETNKLSRYKSLKVAKATNNKIVSLKRSECRLQVNLLKLDLSYNEMTHLEDGSLSCLPSLTWLSLRGNHIRYLTNDTFKGVANLKTLDLAHNKLHTSEPGTFLHCRSLFHLDLSLNKDLSLSGKHVGLFEPLTELEILHIQGCASYGQYPTEVLLVLPALRELAVNGEKQPFDSRLSALRNLTRLVIGDDGFCWTKQFTKSYFIGLPHIESIKIIGCVTQEYSPHMFDKNPRILHLQITHEGQPLRNLLNVLCYLPLDRIKSIIVSDISKRAVLGPLIVLSSNDVYCLSQMKHLVYLNLDMNFISQVDSNFTKSLPPSLETFSIRNNLLISLQAILFHVTHIPGSFPNLRRLFEDSQGGRQYARSERDLFHSSKYTAHQDLYRNCSTNDSTDKIVDLTSDKAQKSLILHRSSDSNMNTSTLNKMFPFHLYIYNASKTVNQGVEVFNRHNDGFKISILDMSKTFSAHWGIFPINRMPPQTLIAYMSENRCESIKETFFDRENSLIELHAGGNFLGPLINKDANGSVFSRLKNLEYLDLSRNHLFHLPWPLLRGTPRLQVLRLESNNIATVDIHIAHMTSLVFVNLAKNSIWSISERTRNQLDNLANRRNISIDLSYNPIPCSCEGFDILRWMTSTPVNILNKDFLVCINANNKQELLGDLPTRVLTIQRECVSKKLLILASSFACGTLLLLAGFVWVFQKRWWILYMWNMAVSNFYGYKTSKSSGKRGRCQSSDNSTRPQYTFDAFFVYSASVSDFVLDECLEELEDNRGHRLCVEDRDFLAGSYIPCNITSAVRGSRKTVVVMDENFRSEGWVQYAVEMAQVEAVRSSRSVLHLVFVGSPPEGHLPSAYLKVLRQGKFSEVPPTEYPSHVMQKFWDSLSHVLGHSERHNNIQQPRLEITS